MIPKYLRQERPNTRLTLSSGLLALTRLSWTAPPERFESDWSSSSKPVGRESRRWHGEMVYTPHI